jgi:hypothetical protein
LLPCEGVEATKCFTVLPGIPEVPTRKNKEEKEMKKKSMVVIGMVVGCLMMVAGAAWAGSAPVIPGVPNANGTVTDGGLVWLQNANCFGAQKWDQAMSSARSLKSGSCGLSDGSTAGQWRLPTKDELVKRSYNQQGFNKVQSVYWSSTPYPYVRTPSGCVVDMGRGGGYVYRGFESDSDYVWPVRGGQ